jgi:hypothetical protein
LPTLTFLIRLVISTTYERFGMTCEIKAR